MSSVIQFVSWASVQQRKVFLAPVLECPKCGKECSATHVAADDETTYLCKSAGHVPLYWRIDPDGNMLRGKVSRRHYRI
jgi:hypothetical protein